MPRIQTRVPAFKKKKDLEAQWENFRGGLNLLLRPTELQQNEMSTADNILLVGSGTPTGRWGSAVYMELPDGVTTKGFGTYKKINGSLNEFLVAGDDGYIYRRNNSSAELITGASFASVSDVQSTQLGGFTYFVTEFEPMVRYAGATLVRFTPIDPPSGVGATNLSGVTGTYTYSYIVTTTSETGETLGSSSFQIDNVPQDLTGTAVQLFWTAPSVSSASLIKGYTIYRGNQGEETLLTSTPPNSTTYVDIGLATSDIIEPPLINTTGGVKTKFLVKYNDRLIAVDAEDPTKVLISGRYPYHDRFSWAYGGGYVYIDPDSGEPVTGIAVQPLTDKLIVYKETSSYQLSLDTITIGTFTLLDPTYQPISTAIGASNQDAISTVENDTFSFGRNGLYVTGYEPQFLNVIRTNEVSARIRPFLETLNQSDYQTANSMYVDNKYLLSFPNKRQMVVYDRERGCFTGIWKLPFGITKMLRHIDGSGTERWVLAANDNKILTFEKSLNTDDGQTIIKVLRTGKNDFKSWSIIKILKYFYILMRAIRGQVNVQIIIEDRNGATATAKTFTIIGSQLDGDTGYGMQGYGELPYGETQGTVSITGDELTRYGTLFVQNRLVQVEVSTSSSNGNFELLGVRLTATGQTEGSLPSSQRV